MWRKSDRDVRGDSDRDQMYRVGVLAGTCKGVASVHEALALRCGQPVYIYSFLLPLIHL